MYIKMWGIRQICEELEREEMKEEGELNMREIQAHHASHHFSYYP